MKNRMKSALIPLLAVTLLAGCGSNKPVTQSRAPEAQPMMSQGPLHYVVNLNDRGDDLFHVTINVDDLGSENAVYQFASTAPGTYQVMDIGRYVRSFKAFDASGAEIPSENISVNQWRISDPESVSRIEYALAETWDTPVDRHPVYQMCGTSIEDDHVLVNGQGVFGYPTGMQDRSLRITIERPASWMVGTALEADRSGDFLADDYDHLVDSPILLGRLSKASLDVRGTTVDVYTYSKTDHVQSAAILEAVDDILNAAGDFLVDLPVDRYTFLFHFEDATVGAWEHSYSSTYVYAENFFDHAIEEGIPDVVAHEFFHIITPLNIHSEIIEEFNFVTPVPSEHLWLYEGTTEWASHAMQLRAGLISADEYLDRMEQKLRIDDNYDASYSLSKLALTSYEDEGYKQYANIYMRGALVAGLLDIRLLELSNGERGLREVLLELSDVYGKDRAFDEETFFETVTEMTYPEIGDFFRDYVQDAKPLPIAEYYEKIGVTYRDKMATGEMVAATGVTITFNGSAFAIGQVGEVGASCGFQVGDEIAGLNDSPVTLNNYQQVFAEMGAIPTGVDYQMTVVRKGEEKMITCRKKEQEQIINHVLDVDPDATPEELALRQAWMVNLQPS
jgi:predicted metalloprotease with PDZ domain